MMWRACEEEGVRFFGGGKVRPFAGFERVAGQGKGVASLGVDFVHPIGGV